MKIQILHTGWWKVADEAAGEILNWSPLGQDWKG